MIKPVRKSREAMEEIFVGPVKGYRAEKVVDGGGVGEMEMADISRRDSKNFAKWMREYGGYHYDEGLKKFVHD